ncbi:hypothetical protein GCM10023322_39870 [Rugosimonospora acidiphila]|uniref:YbaB/EbfC DNA-binding family protein n=1 Tax=Rugosimonospora acidiphila TaxID=556531 RepID=A0ABP9RX48_9ACTN
MIERPDWGAVYAQFDDLRRAIDGFDETQRKMMKITGTAWSQDRLIKAVVGPRGQLIELDIDPKIYRRPDSKALAASVVATVRAAVDDANRRSRELLDEKIPSDMRMNNLGPLNIRKLMETHDSELSREEEDGDESADR